MVYHNDDDNDDINASLTPSVNQHRAIYDMRMNTVRTLLYLSTTTTATNSKFSFTEMCE